MAKPPAKPQDDEAPASPWKTELPFVSVVSTTGRDYWAIGRKFHPREPTLIAKADLPNDEAQALVADPWVVVSEVPGPEKPAEKPAA